MSRAVMQKALETLQFYYDLHGKKPDAKVITALKQALAEPEQHDTDCHLQAVCQRSGYSITTPRKPVELTDSEVDDLTMAIRNAYPLIVTPFYVWCRHFSRAVIAAYEAKQGEQT